MLIALAWPSHLHHSAAHHWFAEHQSADWATCPITQSGFVCLSSNPKILPEAVSPRQALQLLKQITHLPHHVFWEDSVELSDAIVLQQGNIIGYRQITDAYLFSLAIHNNGCLLSFDQGLAKLVPDAYRSSLMLLGCRCYDKMSATASGGLPIAARSPASTIGRSINLGQLTMACINGSRLSDSSFKPCSLYSASFLCINSRG